MRKVSMIGEICQWTGSLKCMFSLSLIILGQILRGWYIESYEGCSECIWLLMKREMKIVLFNVEFKSCGCVFNFDPTERMTFSLCAEWKRRVSYVSTATPSGEIVELHHLNWCKSSLCIHRNRKCTLKIHQ